MQNKLWFRAKRYGWGWYPCSWEGWFTLLLWVIVFALINITYVSNFNAIFRFIFIFISVSVLIYICYKKGEKPEWRWGEPRDKDTKRNNL